MTARMGTRTATLALTAAGMLALIGAIEGLAAKPKIPSTISLNTSVEGDDFIFRGRVRSEEPGCERRRKVEITAGNGVGIPPVHEGTTRTDENGRYELRVKAATNTFGGYRAKALRKTKRRFVCKAARSPIVNPLSPSPAAGG